MSLRGKILLGMMRLSGRDFRRELKLIRLMDEGELDLGGFVRNSLREILTHAREKVPYYGEVLRDSIPGDHPLSPSELDRIPVLSRSQVQSRVKELTSTDMRGTRVITGTTGGSTGKPIRYYRDLNSYRWARATEFFYYERFLEIDEISSKKLLVWGSAAELLEGIPLLQRIIHALTRTAYFNAYLLDEKLLNGIVRKLVAYRPDIVRGFPHFLAAISRHVLIKGLAIPSPKVVVSTGETLTEWRRGLIEEGFGTKVRNFYGAREAPAIAGECKAGEMHVFSFNNLVEIIGGDGRPSRPGYLGRVLVTTLHNRAMPLIRYEIGDMARAAEDRSSCDSPLPVMGGIEGRETEFVLRRDGSLLGGEFFEGIFRVEDWVKEFQIIQEEIETIRILVAQRKGAKPSTDRVEGKIREVMGECEIRWEFVDEVPRPRSGKFLYVRSMVLPQGG